MHEQRSPSERMTSEQRLGMPARFEIDRSRVQSKVSGKTGVSSPVFQTEWSNFGRFSLHRRHISVMEIGPTSTQVESRRGKARTLTNSGASGFIMEASNVQFEFIFLTYEALLCFLSEIQPNYLRNMCVT
jgi:hypothetical protein